MTAATSAVRRSLKALAALCVALVAALACPTAAQAAEFGIEPGSFSTTLSTTQAGAHPDVKVRFTLRHEVVDPRPPDTPGYRAFGAAKTVEVDLPPGLVGDPSAAPRCHSTDFTTCPAETQVGTVRLRTGFVDEMWSPVYNVVPSYGAPAEFAFAAAGLVRVRLQITVRSDGDYGLRTTIDNLPVIAPLVENELTLWGVPADPANDPDRGRDCVILLGWPMSCNNENGLPTTAPRKPFMTNPSVCGPQAPARLAVDEYAAEGVWHRAEAQLPEVTGCDRLAFAGRATVRAQSPQAGAPAGYDVELNVPQNTDPDGLATPPLKTAVVKLPLGTVVSPAVAEGLQTCAEAQFRFGTKDAPTCPAASKIGTVTIDTPLLQVPLEGAAFLADPAPSQLLRLVLVAEARGVRLKLPGRIDADPVTGQLTATFDQNPQLPFSSLRLALKGGPRAVLANPRQCGPASSSATLTAFGGPSSSSTDAFDVTGPCPGGFTPAFSAGSQSAAAGAASPFTLTFARDDADALLQSIDVTLPPGVMPRIGTVPLCAEALTAAGACGEESRVGSASALAGPGGQPYALPGRVYVAGPYRGAPYSLVIVVPAKAGPYDLGTVVVRAAVHVDPRTAALRVVSDPLPEILQGIPLQIRSVRIAIDKPGFMVNPTSCAARQVGATIAAAGGASAGVASRYQAKDCRKLPFAPKLSVKVGGRGQVGAGRPTSLTATLTQAEGQAAARSVRLELPKAINARLEIVRRACTPAAYAGGTCGEAARIGSGSAVTSLLRAPLRGAAYFVRRASGRGLPDLVVQLRGEVAIDLVGKVTIKGTQLVTTFDTIPDVPLSRFQLKLPARTSPVSSAEGLCTKAGRNGLARQTMRGQNGKLVQRKARLAIAGCAKRR